MHIILHCALVLHIYSNNNNNNKNTCASQAVVGVIACIVRVTAHAEHKHCQHAKRVHAHSTNTLLPSAVCCSCLTVVFVAVIVETSLCVTVCVYLLTVTSGQ